MTLDFSGRVAIVTGAGGGLGAAYAKWLARRGAKVVVNNRIHPGKPSSAQEVVAEIRAAGGEAVADHHSVELETSGKAMVEHALDVFGRLDVLVANAAVSRALPVETVDMAVFEEVMAVNFYGSIAPVLAALPRMRAQNYGRIVLTTSAAGLFGGEGQSVYGASKMALMGFMRALAVELRKTEVRINAISPYARTKMSRHALNEDFEELMSADRVAPALGWLVSDRCDRTGIILSAGGGRVRRTFLVESAPTDVTAEGEIDFAALDDLSGVTETRDSRWSSTALVPELLRIKRQAVVD